MQKFLTRSTWPSLSFTPPFTSWNYFRPAAGVTWSRKSSLRAIPRKSSTRYRLLLLPHFIIPPIPLPIYLHFFIKIFLFEIRSKRSLVKEFLKKNLKKKLYQIIILKNITTFHFYPFIFQIREHQNFKFIFYKFFASTIFFSFSDQELTFFL